MPRKQYWLMKSEPYEFSWDDLLASEHQTTPWTGVRNYQARNLMRDDMRVGDGVLFYHSNVKPQVVMGTAKIASAAYPDPTQFDPKSEYHDPKSDPDAPRWLCIDVQADAAFAAPVTRDALKERDDLEGLMLLAKGSRLSVQPVSAEHWKTITRLGRLKVSRKG